MASTHQCLENSLLLTPKGGPGKILVLGGKRGLLGQALVYVLRRKGYTVLEHGVEDVDIFDTQALCTFLDQIQPDCILNTIAYTQVDQAEQEPEMAFRLNKIFPHILANIVRSRGIYLVSYSTDFVFDGSKQSPYSPEDEPHPICVYGKSKLEGEQELFKLAPSRLLIIRTSWLFGPWKLNFVRRVLELADQNRLLPVVHDQIGSPTFTMDLAHYTEELIRQQATGLFHVCNSGQASWCELAAEALGTAGRSCQVQAVTSDRFPQNASRPPYSVLDNRKYSVVSGKKPRPWPQALRDYLFCFESEHMALDD
ncbi:MAG: dTDP-4-dehydrorhamnose reductase [Thermodesulfobacteriota bacterium]